MARTNGVAVAATRSLLMSMISYTHTYRCRVPSSNIHSASMYVKEAWPDLVGEKLDELECRVENEGTGQQSKGAVLTLGVGYNRKMLPSLARAEGGQLRPSGGATT